MKKKQINKLSKLFVIYIILAFICPSIIALANESEEVGYNIQAILPENQHDKAHTYFDLRMKPSQKQTIELLINNTSDKKEIYEISINQAYTNAQGFIDYTESDFKLDNSLKYKISDIVSYEKEIAVAANKSGKYPINIQMPNKSFDGQIMAGIRVMKKKQSDSEGGIKNRVGYVLGLNITETDQSIKRELKLIKIAPAISYGKTSIVATIKNPTMEAYGQLKYVVNITNDDNGESVRSTTYDSGMQIAPNSVYGLAIDWEGNRLVAGQYKLNLIITDAKNNKWDFNEKFTVSTKQASDINQLTVDKDKNPQFIWWLYLAIGTGLFLLVIGLIIFIRLKKKKKKEAERKKRAQRKRKRQQEKQKSKNKYVSKHTASNK